MRLYVCSGTKHKTMLEARNGEGAIKSFPRTGVKSKMAAPSESSTGLQNKTFHCEICDVHVNSETQLKQVSYRVVQKKLNAGTGCCSINTGLITKEDYRYVSTF